jgi:4a-hydroxytetrahydrobiopterin dehydratase
MKLTEQKCVACEGGLPPLSLKKVKEYMSQLTLDWELLQEKKIQRQFKFVDFVKAIAFVNKVAELAEKEGHHPDIAIHYNKVDITLWTHAIGGLFENDFILAAKIEELV